MTAIVSYKPSNYPTIPGGDAKYLSSELAKISVAITKLAEELADLSTRVTALENP